MVGTDADLSAEMRSGVTLRITASRKTLVVLVPLVAAAGLVVIIMAKAHKKPLEPGPDPSEEATQGAPPKEPAAPGSIEMVLIPGGEFLMGSKAEIDARPEHKVSVSSFYMDKYEVTQEAYRKIMGKSPSREAGEKNPVERVRWFDAIKFCNARSARDGLRLCYDLKTRACDFDADGYRLPTEAEWEYACRARTQGDYYFGSDARNLQAHAWFKGNAGGRPHPVGQKRPNPFGLHDMSGNVWEWCNDWYQVDYYEDKPATNPKGPVTGKKKVLRGGSWSYSAESCTSWTRYCDDPGFSDRCVASDDYGFRCVRKAGRDVLK